MTITESTLCTNITQVNISQAVSNASAAKPHYHWFDMMATSAILLGSLLLNGALCWLIHTKPDLRSVPNLMILNLAWCDLLSAVTTGLPTLTTLAAQGWILGAVTCQLTAMLSALLAIASVLTLAMIAVIRCMLIVYSGKSFFLTQMKHHKVVIAGVWLGSFLCALPPLLGWSEYRFITGKALCSLAWSAELSYNATLFVATVLLPFSIMLLCYYRIVRTVRLSRCRVETSVSKIRHITANLAERGRNRQKSARCHGQRADSGPFLTRSGMSPGAQPNSSVNVFEPCREVGGNSSIAEPPSPCDYMRMADCDSPCILSSGRNSPNIFNFDDLPIAETKLESNKLRYDCPTFVDPHDTDVPEPTPELSQLQNDIFTLVDRQKNQYRNEEDRCPSLPMGPGIPILVSMAWEGQAVDDRVPCMPGAVYQAESGDSTPSEASRYGDSIKTDFNDTSSTETALSSCSKVTSDSTTSNRDGTEGLSRRRCSLEVPSVLSHRHTIKTNGSSLSSRSSSRRSSVDFVSPRRASLEVPVRRARSKSLQANFGQFLNVGELQRTCSFERLDASACQSSSLTDLVLLSSPADSEPRVRNKAKSQLTRTKRRLNLHKSARKKHMLTLSIFVVIVVFVLVWTPLALVSFLQACTSLHIPVWVERLAVLIASLNATLNPLIYGLMNGNFRNRYRQVLCPFYKWPDSTPS